MRSGMIEDSVPRSSYDGALVATCRIAFYQTPLSDVGVMPGPARKPIPETIQTAVLLACRRRCAMCFHLEDDLSRKEGQLAHIDRNHANSALENIAFLCLAHHNDYDTKPSQAKGWRPAQLLEIKHKLLQAIADGRHASCPVPRRNQARQADRRTFEELVHTMSSTRTIAFLREANFGEQTFHLRELNEIDELVRHSQGAEREFIDDRLEHLRQCFIAEYVAFRPLLSLYTAPVLWTPTYRTVPVEWRSADPKRYDDTVELLRAAADKVCHAFDGLVREGKRRLSA